MVCLWLIFHGLCYSILQLGIKTLLTERINHPQPLNPDKLSAIACDQGEVVGSGSDEAIKLGAWVWHV